jgi:3D (Asp-Asp-Asp) domain-containing protein
METVYRERRVDGVIESSEKIDQYITKAPVSEQVLAYGAGVPVSSLSAPEGYTVVDNVPSSYKYVIRNAICTAYSSKGGRGASRLGLYAGTVAVNPNEIPYGSLMYITAADGSFVYGWAIATDTGIALMEGIIDIDLYYETYLESVLNGKKALNVYVIT